MDVDAGPSRWRRGRHGKMEEMHATVPAIFLPGARYGLGVIQADASCDKHYWAHFGDAVGYPTRDDGERVVIASNNTTIDSDAALLVLERDVQLLDDAIWATE